jgi:branched-chain amino acid transport system permease protein
LRSRTLIVLAIAALAPVVVRAPDLRAAAAGALFFAAAAAGLNLAVGYAGQPSLAQGAFMGLGAYTTALLTHRAGWNIVAALAASLLVAALASAVLARAVAHLRPAFVAIATWLVAWGLVFAISSFADFTGGSGGAPAAQARLHLRSLGIDVGLNEAAFMVIGVVLVSIMWLITTRVEQRYGPMLAALRSDPGAARAAGIPVERARAAALVGAGAIAGLAGGLLAQTHGVADPTTYAPLLSFALFLAVIVGGPATRAGPLVGTAVVLGVRGLAGIAARAGLDGAEALGAAAVTVIVLALGHGIVSRRAHPAATDEVQPPAIFDGAALEVRAGHVRYGGVVALDLEHLRIEARTVHAIIGGNGSGKTTLLRAIAGALGPDAANIALDGVDVTALSIVDRVSAGIARTFQRTAVAPGLTAAEHVLSGMEPQRRSGLLRCLTRTPSAAAEEKDADARARGLLELISAPDTDVELLKTGEQRCLQIARALACRPKVLLLDEPSAGMDAQETSRLRSLIAEIRSLGCTVVLVEHNLALVRDVADHVTELADGRIAEPAYHHAP